MRIHPARDIVFFGTIINKPRFDMGVYSPSSFTLLLLNTKALYTFIKIFQGRNAKLTQKNRSSGLSGSSERGFLMEKFPPGEKKGDFREKIFLPAKKEKDDQTSNRYFLTFTFSPSASILSHVRKNDPSTNERD